MPHTIQRLRAIHGLGLLVGAVTGEQDDGELEKMGGDNNQPHRRRGRRGWPQHPDESEPRPHQRQGQRGLPRHRR
jgi:hypothetical protein